jgi:nitric oxide reductase activation protein
LFAFQCNSFRKSSIESSVGDIESDSRDKAGISVDDDVGSEVDVSDELQLWTIQRKLLMKLKLEKMLKTLLMKAHPEQELYLHRQLMKHSQILQMKCRRNQTQHRNRRRLCCLHFRLHQNLGAVKQSLKDQLLKEEFDRLTPISEKKNCRKSDSVSVIGGGKAFSKL